MQFIENRTYDELHAGDSVTLARHLRAHDVQALATLAGERLPNGAAAPARADEALWGGALVVAAILGEWPGPGSVCRSQTLRFLAALPTEAPLQLSQNLRQYTIFFVKVKYFIRDLISHRKTFSPCC